VAKFVSAYSAADIGALVALLMDFGLPLSLLVSGHFG
jgi:hypothetical protein